MGNFLLLTALLMASGLGYARYRYHESPLQIWQDLVIYVRHSADSATGPSETPSPASTPALATTPSPTVKPAFVLAPAATPESAATPLPDPLAWIVQHRERWPRELQLVQATEFPAVYDGRVIGTTLAPTGSSVQVVEVGREQTRVKYINAEKVVATTATNLLRYAALEMARKLPPPVLALTASATPKPVSMASATPESTQPADSPLASPIQPGSEPRVYVGSAYQPAVTDMATKPDEWKFVREHAGFHEHPVGWHPTYTSWGLGQEILSAYKNHYFTAEEDIGGLAHGHGGTHWAETVIAEGRKYGQQWHCVALVVNFHTPQMVDNPPQAAQDLKNYCEGADGLHIPYYLLFSPVSPEAVKIFDETNKPYENQPVWVWVAQHAGAAGVAIDCPATFISNPRWRTRGVEICRTTQQAHLKFIWMFNGGTDTAVTERAAQTLRGLQVRPDYWIVSHFHDDKYPGTPEDKNGTVTSQARVLIKGNY